MKISVLITTRNRCRDLYFCLKSLILCRPSPYEIIVVDNASSDKTEKMIKTVFSNKVKYFREERRGIPYGRNSSIYHASGDILAFVDDDCIVNKRWVEFLLKAFRKTPDIVGLVGKVENYFVCNPYAIAEQCWYVYWRLKTLESVGRKQEILSGDIIDFKNIAFRVEFIRKFKFNETMSTGDFGVEDREISWRIMSNVSDEKKLYYYPAVEIFHKNNINWSKLLKRRFVHGVEMARLMKKCNQGPKVEYKTIYIRFRIFRSWVNYSIAQMLRIKSKFDKIIFIIFFTFLPLVGVFGKLYFYLTSWFFYSHQNQNRNSDTIVKLLKLKFYK